MDLAAVIWLAISLSGHFGEWSLQPDIHEYAGALAWVPAHQPRRRREKCVEKSAQRVTCGNFGAICEGHTLHLGAVRRHVELGNLTAKSRTRLRELECNALLDESFTGSEEC